MGLFVFECESRLKHAILSCHDRRLGRPRPLLTGWRRVAASPLARRRGEGAGGVLARFFSQRASAIVGEPRSGVCQRRRGVLWESANGSSPRDRLTPRARPRCTGAGSRASSCSTAACRRPRRGRPRAARRCRRTGSRAATRRRRSRPRSTPCRRGRRR